MPNFSATAFPTGVLRIPDVLGQGNTTQDRKAEAENLFQKGIEQFRRSQFGVLPASVGDSEGN